MKKQAKVFSIRAARKSSHIATRALSKGLKLTTKVEDKATKILTGADFSVAALEEVSFEKIFYNGIPYNIAPLNPALPALGREGAVTLLIPSLTRGSFYGGTATALIIAGKLAVTLGKPLRIIETLEAGGKDGLGTFFSDNNIAISEADVDLIDVSSRRYNVYGYVDIHKDDVYIASAWWDAHLLAQLPLSKKFIYLIQDFEPIFYANSDKYVLAENTYRSDRFIPICNTELMYNFMADRYPHIKKNGVWFEPAVSQSSSGMSVKKKESEKKRIFLYGRPNVERNLFYSALSALDKLFMSQTLSGNEWEVYMAGQDKIPNITLTSDVVVKNLGKLTMEEYKEFAKSVDLTVSLMMAPHPNYPTLEMSSIGSAVVTTKYANKQDLSSYSKNIYMADLTIDSIANSIVTASNIPYEQRLENARKSNISGDWDKALSGVFSELIKKLTLRK